MNTSVWLTLLLAVAQAISGWLLWRAARTAAALEARLARQHDALALLAETSESGFAAVAREIGRLASVPARPARKPSTRRMASAARRGEALHDIAAAEQVSEGEVRLRLTMAEQTRKREGGRAAVRA